jgi:predicted TIM-barrel fold metal-dependent hydrolase
MDKIDTHQHLLYPEHFTYSWTNGLPVLQGPFRLEEYDRAAAASNVTATLFMEVDVDDGQAEREAAFFCSLAGEDNQLAGVIASCRPEQQGFDEALDRIAHPHLKGLRRIFHVQPDALLESATVRAHLARLWQRSLTFDLCVLQRQLPLAAALARDCPNTQFILDHCGVPDIAGHGYEDWLTKIHAMAALDNVACKVSGIVAYTDANTLNAPSLRPYVEGVIEAFGWDRVVWGSDWPVCNLTASLPTWSSILDEILIGESQDNLAKLFAVNARRLYRIS